MDVILKNDSLTVTISSFGAEIQSVVDKEGRERMWNGDPAFWTGRAPVLFPVAGGLRNDGYQLDGQWYSMPKHGFARREEWKAVSTSDTTAAFVLKAQNPGFPFRYALHAIYTLMDNRIDVTYLLENRDERTLYASVGAHEAYACPGSIEEYEIVFDQPETLLHHPLQGNLIPHEGVCLGENVKTLALNEKLLENDALVFLDLKSTGVELRHKPTGSTVRVDYAGNSTLMFWHKPGAPYLCIEPWNNHPDFVDAPLDIAKKPDYICLKPGEQAVRNHMITFR